MKKTKKEYMRTARSMGLGLFFTSLALLTACLNGSDDLGDVIIFNDYRTTMGVERTLNVEDTLWITGSASSQGFNMTTQDSVFATPAPNVSFIALQLVTPGTSLVNARESFSSFEPLTDVGVAFTTLDCQNTLLIITPELSSDESSYVFRMGFIAKEAGDFVFSWNAAELTNDSRNTSILEDYRVQGFPNRVNFDRCNDVAFRDLDNSQSEFFFSVVE